MQGINKELINAAFISAQNFFRNLRISHFINSFNSSGLSILNFAHNTCYTLSSTLHII